MNNIDTHQQVQQSLIEKIFDCLENSASTDKLLELTTTFNQLPQIQTDTKLLQSMTILNFLAKQVQNSNRDLVSQKMIQESYIYILETLLPNDRLIEYKLLQQRE